jgi:hypothetical protein
MIEVPGVGNSSSCLLRAVSQTCEGPLGATRRDYRRGRHVQGGFLRLSVASTRRTAPLKQFITSPLSMGKLQRRLALCFNIHKRRCPMNWHFSSLQSRNGISASPAELWNENKPRSGSPGRPTWRPNYRFASRETIHILQGDM